MIYLGLGSNVGDRLQNLQSAVDELTKIGDIKAISKVYETDPWGKTDQPAFLNACISIETELPAEDLLEKIKLIETEIGRIERERWGPREIDIDILFYGNQQINSQRLTIPHPLLHERSFMLVPLNDIADDLVHPKTGQTMSDLLEATEIVGIIELSSSINLR